MEQRKTRFCFFIPQSPYLWHCLSILFIVCLIVNGIIYLESFKTNTINFKDLRLLNPIKVPIQNTDNADYENVTVALPVVSSVVNPHNYEYTLNEPDACDSNILVIILVCTSMKNFDEREAIRNTWGSVGKQNNSTVAVLYLVGSGGSAEMQTRLENESRYERDIIQENFIDSYRNLSIKSQAMLKWVQTFCMTAKYMLKADDDMFINVPNLLNLLKKQKDDKFILGVTFNLAAPVQSFKSKWYTPKKDFNEKYYPRYVSGTAYAMSTITVPDLYRASLQIKMFWLEDIYITGLCARKAGIKRINDYGFHYSKIPATGCTHSNSITGHRNSIKEIYKIYQELHNPNLKCNK